MPIDITRPEEHRMQHPALVARSLNSFLHILRIRIRLSLTLDDLKRLQSDRFVLSGACCLSCKG